MGLVTRRSLQLDKLFDQLAVDPKKKKPLDKKKSTPTANKKQNKKD